MAARTATVYFILDESNDSRNGMDVSWMKISKEWLRCFET